MATPRLFTQAPISAGAILTFEKGQAVYLGRVMRLSPGAAVTLFNGRNGEWSARIVGISKKSVEVEAVQRLRSQLPEPGPWLAFAPVKKVGTDFIIQKATELGVERFCPIFTRHTATKRLNTSRFMANVAEAAEQCERLTLPIISPPCDLENLIAGWPRKRWLLVCDETGHGKPLEWTFDNLAKEDGGSPACGFLIGPEGGLEATELARLASLPFVRRVSLGPRILRAETAALAALACWQSRLGDW